MLLKVATGTEYLCFTSCTYHGGPRKEHSPCFETQKGFMRLAPCQCFHPGASQVCFSYMEVTGPSSIYFDGERERGSISFSDGRPGWPLLCFSGLETLPWWCPECLCVFGLISSLVFTPIDPSFPCTSAVRWVIAAWWSWRVVDLKPLTQFFPTLSVSQYMWTGLHRNCRCIHRGADTLRSWCRALRFAFLKALSCFLFQSSSILVVNHHRLFLANFLDYQKTIIF